ncbi:MAG: glycosyltransferase family 1 protein [Aggregatilineales bacterium]
MPTASGLTTTSSSRARIGIDYTPAQEQGGGIGRYVRQLVTALARLDQTNEYRLFVAGTSESTLPPAPGSNFEWAAVPVSARNFARLWHRLHLPLPVELFTGHVDLYHATDFVLPPLLASTRSLLTVHDLSFVRVPEATSPRLKAYLDRVVPRSVHRADHVLADSQATKDDLVALYAVPPHKITVLLSGVDPRFKPVNDPETLADVRQKYFLPERPYILSVGTVQPRKNYGRLIEALARLRAAGRSIDLVIVGGRGWLEDPIYAAIQRAAVHDYVHFTGFADDADLPALYSAAACVAVPSLYEGFGLPVLEAMACGTPVVTSNVSSLPEVAGDAALTVPPTDLDALTSALERLLDDESLRSALIGRGLERIKFFTWERAAQQLLEIYITLVYEKS